MLGDPAAADVVGLAGLAVEAAEEEGAGRLLAELLGLGAQVVAECLGVGAGGGGVLADDDLFGHVLGHPGQGCVAGVVMGPLLEEFMVERRHTPSLGE